MFKALRRLVGIAPAAADSNEAFSQLNTLVPLKPIQSDAPVSNETRENTSFVCREAVLNRNERVAGYQFSLGRKLRASLLERNAVIRRTYDEAMLGNLAPLGVSSLLGDRFALIRVSADSLKSKLLKTFAHSNTFVMISPGTIAEAELEALRTGVQHLQKIGIKLGWTIDRPRPELNEFLNAAELVEIEATELDGIQLKLMCRDFRASKANPKLIASGLQTLDDFSLCYQCGFDFFMGAFVSSRENWHPPKSEINRPRVFEVLNMIRAGAELDAIADKLRHDPILTYKLLRYINSPGIGLLHKVDDISKALILLGRDRFYRWLSLLVFDFNQVGYQGRILNEQSLTRARFMEGLAGKGHIPNSPDQLFIVGLFSLLDVMMNQPFSSVMKQISLPDVVASAIVGEPGPMKDALSLAIAIESEKPEEIEDATDRCGLNSAAVTGLMIEALAWAQQICTSGE